MATSDLTPVDYYLWGTFKYKCYADKLEAIDALKDSIREAFGEIHLHTIDSVLKNWTDRVGYCMTSHGSHLNEIIFYYQPEGLHFQIKKEICENIQWFFLKHFSKKKVFGGPYAQRVKKTIYLLTYFF